MYIPVVLGTAREGAQSEKVANFVLEEVKKYGFETELIKVGEYISNKTERLKDGSQKANVWNEIVSKSDGFIFIVPEYNHSFSGELKLLLDFLYKEYYGKVVGLVGVSGGAMGGVRGAEHLKPVLNNFGMIPTQRGVFFSRVGDLFNESGDISDESYKEKLTGLFDEIKSIAEKLKS